MQSLAVPPPSDKVNRMATGSSKRRESQLSQPNSSENVTEYRDRSEDNQSSKQSTLSRVRSETERPLPRQVSTAFDDHQIASNNDQIN